MIISRPIIQTQRLEELKKEGHTMIDKLVSMGVQRDLIYRKLQKQLKSTKNIKAGHFSTTNTIQECELIIKKLNRMIIAEQVKNLQITSRKTIDREMVEILFPSPKLTWWSKFKLWISQI